MSKNSATVIKDGQLAVATVPQTGTLVGAASEIDATALVETADGLQLCVKTCEVGGGGGGGTVDQTYDPTSTNAQSGTAVAEAVAPSLRNKVVEGAERALVINPSQINDLGYSGTTYNSIVIRATNQTYALRTNQTVVGSNAGGNNINITCVGASAQTSSNYGTALGCGASAIGGTGSQGGGATSVGESATASQGTALGSGTHTNSSALAVGRGYNMSHRVEASAFRSIAIGVVSSDNDEDKVEATAQSAIQLGNGVNSTANSFQVFNYQMLDANGHIPNERIYYPQPLYKGYTITGSDVTVNDNNIASGFTSYGNQDNRNSYLLVNNKIPNSFGLLEMYVGFTCGNYNEDKGYSLITRNDSISTTWYVQGNPSDNTDYRIQRWNGTDNVVGSTSLSKDQSYVARYIYNKTNGNTEQCDLYINGAWVNQWNNSNVSVTWNNIYVGIGGAYCYGDTSQTGSINLNQTAIYVDGVCLFNGVKNWIPSTAAITGVPGYDSTKTQVLKNVNGVLTWVDE